MWQILISGIEDVIERWGQKIFVHLYLLQCLVIPASTPNSRDQLVLTSTGCEHHATVCIFDFDVWKPNISSL